MFPNFTLTGTSQHLPLSIWPHCLKHHQNSCIAIFWSATPTRLLAVKPSACCANATLPLSPRWVIIATIDGPDPTRRNLVEPKKECEMMLSGGVFQRLFSFAFLGIGCIMLALFIHLCCVFGAAPTSAASDAWHENVGVLRYVNPKIGTYGVTPNGNGGMIPSVSPPFGMTRWTPQTREVRD